MYLPPVTPTQARYIYSLLHVTPAMVRLDHLYDRLYFGSLLLHLIARIAFLALGISALVRDWSDRFAARCLEFGGVRRTQLVFHRFVDQIERVGVPISRVRNFWRQSPPGRLFAGYSVKWLPALVRSAFIYYILYTLFFSVLWSPLNYFDSYTLPHRYGLSHESFGQWLIDLLKDTSTSAVLGAFLSSLIVWGIAMFPKRWATVFALWSFPIIFTGIFLDPVFDQVDNHFTKLPQSSALYAPLHQLVAKAGVPQAVILVADKSKQTEETNAYVTGLGSSAQIVLWDTTIKRMKPDEIVAITGHELGHYVEHHVIIGGLLAAASMFLFLPALKAIAELLVSRFGDRWKITTLSDPAALPILLISLSILSFLVSPVTNAVSRYIEHRADSFGLAITGNRMAMARAMVDLANQNLDNPYPTRWEVFWLADHPPFGERIRFSLYGQPVTSLRTFK